ncbi:ABC transporter substrate-binding protein [Vibrio sp.]|nr:ABC transporter substrate-binding protein [Vibrio sp.]
MPRLFSKNMVSQSTRLFQFIFKGKQIRNGYAFLCLILLSAGSFSVSAYSKERIVTLTPHSTSLAISAGLRDSLVGVSEHSINVDEVPIVAGYNYQDTEHILALNPTLVLALPSMKETKILQLLSQNKVTILYHSPQTLEQVSTMVLTLSDYAIDPSIGKKAVKKFNQRVDNIKQKYSKKRKMVYFYQLGGQPSYTMSEGSWPSEAFQLCGGTNMIPASSIPYLTVGLEDIVVGQPEAIFISHSAVETPQEWTKFQDLLPVKQVHKIQSEWLNIPSLHSIEAVEEICHTLDTIR